MSARRHTAMNVPGRSIPAITAFALLTTACGSTVSELPPGEQPGQNRQFRIECIHLDDCKKKASATCGSSYKVVSEWHNTIPESELPGLNEETRPKDARDWNRHTLPDVTGIESREPMPLSSIVVACNG